jgi:hypothetical protein
MAYPINYQMDFDYPVKATIEKSKSIFQNLAKRYPNDYELGRAIRQIISEL